MVACTPRVDAPCSNVLPSSAQVAASMSFERMSCAHLRPGRFQPLEAAVAVTVCPAVSSLIDA